MSSHALLQTNASHDNLTGRVLGDGFLLGEELDHGGCATIYRARQQRLERDVVVKVLRADKRNDRILQARFLREAKLASMLVHPYAAHIYAFGIDEQCDQLMWIAMELVDGITLEQWLEENGPMPLQQLVPLIECAADVIHAAHQLGIIHRDLKPQNMMVTEWNGQLRLKLLDFGVAKAPPSILPRSPRSDEYLSDDVEGEHQVGRITAVRVQDQHDRLTRLTQSRIGSPAYMAPEQWDASREVAASADIYALGITIYWCLAGRSPFIATDIAGYEYQHKYGAPTPLVGNLASINPIIRRALAKAPDQRHPTALELASELRTALRSTAREQIRFAAQQWQESKRSPELLWDQERLSNRTHRAEHPLGQLSPLECSFIAASQRRARRSAWLRRMLGVFILALIFGGMQYRSLMRTRVLEAGAAQAELEQGRAALLHGEPDAIKHLSAAYVYDLAPSTAFMLARAMEPKLAERMRLTSSFGRMWSARFSPDGQQIVTTDDLNAQVWDAQTGDLRFTLRHGDVVYQAEYTATGEQIVTGCGDSTVRIWDARNEKLIRELRPATTQSRPRYYAVAISTNGRFVAGLSLGPGAVSIWSMATGDMVGNFAEDDGGSRFPTLAFSSDDQWLAMSTGHKVHVLETKTWRRIETLPATEVHSFRWDPLSARLLTGGGQGAVSIWSIPEGAQLERLRESGASVEAVAFSPNSKFAAAGDRDGIVQVWRSSALLVSQNNYKNKILALDFDKTASLLSVGSASGLVEISDLASGMPLTVLEGSNAAMKTVQFAPHTNHVLGASWDGTARIWSADASYRSWLSARAAEHCGPVMSTEPDHRYIATACDGDATQVWDTLRGTKLAELPNPAPVGNGFAAAHPLVSIAGDRAAIVHDSTIDLYDLPSTKLRQKIRHSALVTAISFNAAGDLVSGDKGGALVVTRVNGTRIELPNHSVAIDVVSFLPGGRVAAADAQQSIYIYDPYGSHLAVLKAQARVTKIRVSNDGRRLITASTMERGVTAPQLWDLEHYLQLGQLVDRGQGQVLEVRFADSARILTASSDGAARLWSSEAGRLLMTYRGSPRFLADAALSDDGTMVLAGGGGGDLRIWDIASGRQLWVMPAHKSDLFGVHVEGDTIVTRGFSGEIAGWRLPTARQVLEACADDQRCAIVAQ